MDTPVIKLEQTVGSVIAYMLQAAQEAVDAAITPFVLRNVPDNWVTPSVHFPPPEVSHRPQTLHDFQRRYTMYTMWFGRSVAEAQLMADAADMAIHTARDSIPLLDESGKPLAHRFVRMRPDLQSVRVSDPDAAAARLMVEWITSVRYNEPEHKQWTNLNLNMYGKNSAGQRTRY